MEAVLAPLRLVVASAILLASGPTGSVFADSSWPMTDAGDWLRMGVVLDVGPTGSPDDVLARDPAVLWDEGLYHMWYAGFDGERNRVMYATSTDAVAWAKHGVAIDVLQPPHDFDSVGARTVVKVGSGYRMWFTGGYWSGGPSGMWAEIYYADSADAVTWTIGGISLPMGSPGTWDGSMVHTPTVIKDSSGLYFMYYQGWDGTSLRIGLATSTDGSMFTRVGAAPVLDLGPPGSWDDEGVWSPSVVVGSPWRLWYTGSSRTMTRIGLATSSDGFNWTKSGANPDFTEGPAGAWDDAGVERQTVILDPAAPAGTGRLAMYYTGFNGTNARIGLARQIVSEPGSVTVDCDPNTINLRAAGRWIVCYVEPPTGRLATEIDSVAVRLDTWLSPVLNGRRGFSWDPAGYLADHNHDGVQERMLKFDRQILRDRLTAGEHTFLVEGEYSDGSEFRGQSDATRVIA